MNRKNTLLVLWIIFGFIFITAIDSILYFIVHLIYFGLANLGTSYKIMTYLIPFTTLILYLLTTYLLITKIKTKSKTSGIYITEFPKKTLMILGIIAFVLSPITNKLSGIYSENVFDNTIVNSSDFLVFYGWLHTGFGLSQLLVLLILIIIMLTKLKSFDNAL